MVNRIASFAVLIVAATLGGCGTSGFDDMRAASKLRAARAAAPPLPVVTKFGAGPVPVATAQAESPPGKIISAPLPSGKPAPSRLAEAGGGSVVVGPGETLYGLSRRTGVSVADLVSANKLMQPYVLVTGQSLAVPKVRYYTVEPGETASGIAKQTGVAVAQLAKLNNLDDSRTVRQGQRLRLPLDAILPKTRAEKAADRSARAVEAPKPVVAALPPVTVPSAVPVPADAAPVTNSPVAESTVRPAAETAVVAAAEKPVGPRPVFAWPLAGRILSGFGAKPNGQFNDGVNIAARPGQTVQAAADGEVVYADSRLKGFGNLLLVRHANGWLTAYAHAETLLVRKGEKVQRGEAIARAGSTGAVRTTQLHFEVRFNRKPLDPVRVLPDRALVLTQGATEAREPNL